MTLREMTPREYAARAEAGPAPLLLDVREGWELAIARLDGVLHIPMGEIPARLGELAPEQEIVVLCRSGGRSATVARFLQQQGYRNVWNLAGGILAWSEQLDPSLTQY
ncbi:MAG: rhodanese-like domain-containing protein [Gammaproteobacteria bacterium]